MLISLLLAVAVVVALSNIAATCAFWKWAHRARKTLRRGA